MANIFRRLKSKIHGVIIQTRVGIELLVLPFPGDDNLCLDGEGNFTSKTAGGGGITELTGDVTAGPGTGSQAATLSATGVVAGTYGDSTNVGQFTVDAKGRITFATTASIAGGSGITQLTGDGTAGPGSGSQALTLANTAVTPGTYGDATHVAQVTFDSKGRATLAANVAITFPARVFAIPVVIDGGGVAIAAGDLIFLEIPVACTITAVRMFADQTGSIVVDIWKDTYANFPPAVGDSITASAKPTISSGVKSQDTTLTGWTKTISAGDILAFNVDSASSVERVTVELTVTT